MFGFTSLFFSAFSLLHGSERLQITNVEKFTDKKEKKIFLIYEEIQKGAVAKLYMSKGFLIYEEFRKFLVIYCMRRPLVIYDFATAPF
jgi:hypothetical protein